MGLAQRWELLFWTPNGINWMYTGLCNLSLLGGALWTLLPTRVDAPPSAQRMQADYIMCFEMITTVETPPEDLVDFLFLVYLFI